MLFKSWYNSQSVTPEGIAKRRDSKAYARYSHERYISKLEEGKVRQFAKKYKTGLYKEKKIEKLPEGNYMILAECSDAHNDVNWFVKFRITTNQTTELILDNSNAY